MALVTMGWELAVTLVDNGANVTTMRFDLRSADATEAATDTGVVIAALDAISNAVISDYYIKHKYSENALSYPAAGIENEDKASLTCLLAGAGNIKANLKIPAPVIGIFSSSSGGGAKTIDVDDVDLNTYIDLFRSGNECYISRGRDLTSLVSGKRISAKSMHG